MKILVFGSMRSGSTYLAKKLSKKYDIINLDEILHIYELDKKLKEGYFNDTEVKIWLDVCSNKLKTKNINLEDTYIENLNKEIFSELCAEFYLKYLEKYDNFVIKILSHSLFLDDAKNYNFLIKFAKMVDKIYYTQRINSMDQIVSLCVAVSDNVFYSDRQPFTKELSNEQLDWAYQNLKKQVRLLNNMYFNYPGEIITLENIPDQNPYPNKFTYKGDWVLPKKLPLIHE